LWETLEWDPARLVGNPKVSFCDFLPIAVGSLDDALGLTGAQQSAIGFFCGTARPTISVALTDAQCTPANYGATRLMIPAPSTENDDHNTPRIAPRHVCDIGAGTDNLFRKERFRTTLRISVTNYTGCALQLPLDI
jgi:hypothetical protein